MIIYGFGFEGSRYKVYFGVFGNFVFDSFGGFGSLFNDFEFESSVFLREDIFIFILVVVYVGLVVFDGVDCVMFVEFDFFEFF